jgi:hypothetical protein
MALTKSKRNGLPDSDFAVPNKRALPMHDETHVRLAWDMVSRTHGLTPEEKSHARSRILKKAHSLGIDTDEWNKKEANAESAEKETENEKEKNSYEKEEMHAVRFEALAMVLPDISDHPNRLPFKGILTRVDKPSDNPLGGSDGKCVILPKSVAEKALPTLIGMAIDFTPDLSGHDAQSKIGLITEANISGDAIDIGGFFYASDFPGEVKRIREEKARMGFSYECQAQISDLKADPWIIKDCIFTGAAVLYKDKAAYTSTALHAQKEEKIMEHEADLKVMDTIESLRKEIDELRSLQKRDMIEDKDMRAGSIHAMVKPHADRLRSCAAAMEAAGIGMHAKHGHVAVLHHMADSMEADASIGKVPHVYQVNDYLMNASANVVEDKKMSAIEDALKSISTKLADLEASKFEASAAPERKTLDPSIAKLLAKSGIESSGKNLDISAVNKALDDAGFNTRRRFAAKVSLAQSGLIDQANA